MTRAPGFHLLIITAYLASTAEAICCPSSRRGFISAVVKIERRWIGNWRILVGEGPTYIWITQQSSLSPAALVAVAAIAAAGWMYLQKKQTKRLRSRFGPEYDRLADVEGGRARVEKTLHERENG